ncbi:MAG TPA: hypothetical protein VGE52_04730, partial [Pirellulales bacterium]
MSDSRASYRLVVSSPQGGSAKTTTAEALAWWAAHHKVRAVVSSERKAPSEGDEASEPRLTIVDAPRLGTPIARRALLDAD